MAHRDVNTRNILVKPDLSCVIADFGFTVGMMGSKIIKNGVAENAEQASLADVGTLRYMAPEVFDGAVNLRDCEASLKQIDIYALGLVLWEVASRCLDLYQGAPVPDYQLPFQAEAGIHPTFEEMQVLVVKYKSRPKFPEVWKDSNPAVRSLRETIEDCWDTDAEARLTSLCVQERVTDIAVLWVNGTKHRGVTPTLNATMNLPEAYPNHSPNLAPSYINRKNETNAGGESVDADVQAPVISNSTRRRGEQSESYPDGITAPLITNVGQLTMSASVDMTDGRVRSWLHDQSVSESTVDTILPRTPSHDEIMVKADQSAPPPLKANNVMLAMNKAVISHPNQGRNPTVERNTHKRSDEELTVSGNRLLGPGDQITDTSSPSSERRGSFGTQSAPPNHSHSFNGMDTVESSSLVQNDALSHQHGQPRSNPIPYLQNQVHIDGAILVSAAPSLTRPKLANINSNRNSYLRLQGDDTSPSHKKTEDSLHSKSLKHRLSKLIWPIDLGHKFSKMVFGGKNKKRLDAGSGEVEVMTSKCSGPSKTSGHLMTTGQDACPLGRISNSSAGSLNMEVQMVNGEAVTRACSDANYHLHSNPMSEAQSRLSATNAMRLGVLSQDDFPSASLFPKSLTSSVSSDTRHQETALPLQNLASSRDYGSMHLAVLNTTFVLDMPPEIPTNTPSNSGLANKSRSVMSDTTPLSISHQEPIRALSASLSKCTATSLHGEENCWTVKSPQNKTITPINSQFPPGKILRKKVVPDELQGAAFNNSSLFQNDNHIPDTKGGNAVMFDIQVSDKSLSRGLHSVGPEKPFKKQGHTGIIGNRESKNIPPIRLSQSQSVTDLGWHQRCKSDGMQGSGKVWHELSGNNGFHRHRPKSLSLKGHNYNDYKPEPRKSSSNEYPSAMMTPVVLKATSNEQVKHNENGTLPMVVPNITLDKSSLPFLSTNIDKQVKQTQSLAVSSVHSFVPSSVSDGSTKQTVHEKISHRPVNGLTAEEKKNLYAADRSDSSEKIRRRIKTPVSFKKGRLSLYDDRLMSQSLGPESLTHVVVDQVTDSNMIRAVLVNGRDESGQGFRDYHKMIQSDSDLVL
ncbi:hypothetical protein Btru_051109 [Bulinus truncatus]|nr:hypothetical protein Btru_051109 [Bulinus truncatus]